MKIQKGEPGYIHARKSRLVLYTILSFAWVFILIAAGYIVTKTKLNLLTIIAMIGCIPACMSLVNLIMLIPHHSVSEPYELELSSKSEHLSVLYDLVITSEKKVMPIEAVVVSSNTVCGYSKYPGLDTVYTAQHIRSILEQNKLDRVTVKIFQDYKAFISRVEGMNNIAYVDKHDPGAHEAAICQILKDISL